jgi:hypothetical protein
MKTAMQIAIESYKNDGVSFTDWFIDNYEILLEKEKEQIIDAYYGGVKLLSGDIESAAKHYYNQNYNQNK